MTKRDAAIVVAARAFKRARMEMMRVVHEQLVYTDKDDDFVAHQKRCAARTKAANDAEAALSVALGEMPEEEFVKGLRLKAVERSALEWKKYCAERNQRKA